LDGESRTSFGCETFDFDLAAMLLCTWPSTAGNMLSGVYFIVYKLK